MTHRIYDPLDPGDLAAKITGATRRVWREAAGSVTLAHGAGVGLGIPLAA
ncbi:MAG: hypothetical protein QM740_13180 [Acidovorax sp.]